MNRNVIGASIGALLLVQGAARAADAPPTSTSPNVLAATLGASVAPNGSTGSVVPAQGGAVDPVREAVESRCDYLRGVAGATSALLVAPRLVNTTSMVRAMVDNGDGTGLMHQVTRLRIRTGAEYSVAELRRGLAVREEADAECEAYRSTVGLLAFTEQHRAGLYAPALERRQGVLRDAVPRAEEILAATRQRVKDGLATEEQLHAIALRVDVLKLGLNATAQELELARGAPVHQAETLPQLLAEQDRTQRLAEEAAAKVRRAGGWDFAVEGGYDKIFGPMPFVPLYAQARASFNLGMLYEKEHNDRAIAARPRMARSTVGGPSYAASEAARALQEELRARESRLADVVLLLADHEQRLKLAERHENQKVAMFAEHLWFDTTSLRAEKAFLEEQSAQLRTALGLGKLATQAP